MNKAVRVISKQFDDDVAEATAYYQQFSDQVAANFLDQLEQRVWRLQITPKAGQLVDTMTRTTKIDRFPYLIHYRFLQNMNIIYLFRCVYAGRDPQ